MYIIVFCYARDLPSQVHLCSWSMEKVSCIKPARGAKKCWGPALDEQIGSKYSPYNHKSVAGTDC